MPPKRKAAKKGKGQPAAKRQRKHDDPVWCTESEKSPLVHEDLHALYSNPNTYKDWTKEDWVEARECLPEDAPYNEDGYSVPIEYFKHDVDWRRYVREFQEDLGAGKLDPEWQRQAQQAMDERARGDFDKYKADQFEQFWGQRQKTSHLEIAGESAKIKFGELVENQAFRRGDILSFQRVFGKGKDRIMVEKDARIMEIDGGRVVVGVPPGQLKYARYIPSPNTTLIQPADHPEPILEQGDAQHEKSACPSVQAGQEKVIEKAGAEQKDGNTQPTESDRLGGGAKPFTGLEESAINDPLIEKPDGDIPKQDSSPRQIPASTNADRQYTGGLARDLSHEAEGQPQGPDLEAIDGKSAEHHTNDESLNEQRTSSPSRSSNNIDVEVRSGDLGDPHQPVEDVVLVTISGPAELERHMVKIDGRIGMQGFRSANSWKAIRAHRDNQDMGSLFDVRERFYVEHSSMIVKEPQRARRSGREVKASKR